MALELFFGFLRLKSKAKLIVALYDNKILEVINNKKHIKNNQKSAENLCGWEDAHFLINIGSILDLSLNKKSHKNMHSQIYS